MWEEAENTINIGKINIVSVGIADLYSWFLLVLVSEGMLFG